MYINFFTLTSVCLHSRLMALVMEVSEGISVRPHGWTTDFATSEITTSMDRLADMTGALS